MRKTVTVLFADAPALPDADVESGVRAAAAFYACLRQVLEEHGGTVERPAGDAVMAVFGVPAARDDDARRAAAAALAVQAAVASLPGSPRVSLGISTGEVLTGDGSAEQELAVGDTVVVAARLQQLAAPGEVLLGPDTVRLLEGRARFGPPRDACLRGRVGELGVVPLLALEEPVDLAGRGPYVGRDLEQEVLRGVLSRTCDGGVAQLLTVLGEAGTGKSRLVHEVLAERAGEVLVLRGTCRGYGDRSTWSALVELLHEVTDAPAGASAAYVLEGLARRRPQLVGVLPVLASLLGDGDTPVGRSELSWAVARALAVVAEQSPVAVVLEDLHLADQELLALLPQVVRRLEGSPVLVVVTARPELLEHTGAWGLGLRHVFGLTLRALEPAAARQLAERLVPGDAAGADAIVVAANGNPLFLEQLAQAHHEGSGAPAPSVAAVLAARLDRLPLESRQVLERAAVVGSWGEVRDLHPLCDGLDLEAALLALARRDLLLLKDGRWSFGSELVREAAAAGLTRDDRARLHEARGLALAGQGASAQGEVLSDAAEAQELLGDLGASQVLLRDAVQRYQRKGAAQAIRLVAQERPGVRVSDVLGG